MAKKFSRRDFLSVAALATVGSVLAACKPQVVKETVVVEKPVEKVVTKVVKETVVVEKPVEKVVTKVVEKEKVVTKVVKETVVVEKRPKMRVLHRREYFKEMEILFEKAVKQWAKENNVDVEVSTVGAEAFQDFVAKMVAAVQAGNPPDLVYHIRLVQQLYFLDALEPVSDVVDRAQKLYGDVPYLQKLLNYIDGEWWGIPFMVHGGGQFARKDIFEGNGIDPFEMETYDQRRDGCLKVSDPDKEMYGWGITVNRSGDGSGFIAGIIHNWGGHITDKEMTKLTFNSPETVAAVEWLTEIYTADKWAPMLPPGIMSWTDSSNNEAYLAGKIAYTHNAASVYAKAKADKNPVFEKTVVLPEAIGPLGKRLSGSSGGQFNIPKGAKNIQLAKGLALYMLQPDVFIPISLTSAGLFLPSYAKYYEMDKVKKAFEKDPNLERMGKSAMGDYPGLSWPADPSPFFDAISAQTILTDMMAQTITQGVKPADAVKQAADRMAQIAEEMGVFKK
ncbi:MAG: extracellular solute-binding protein [Anaerolineae bacterium]|nr:extracellular solute-binding protein [Anaerolineae bacterium]